MADANVTELRPSPLAGEVSRKAKDRTAAERKRRSRANKRKRLLALLRRLRSGVVASSPDRHFLFWTLTGRTPGYQYRSVSPGSPLTFGYCRRTNEFASAAAAPGQSVSTLKFYIEVLFFSRPRRLRW